MSYVYEVWQATHRGWTLSREHVYRWRWRARLRAWCISLSYPHDSVYRRTRIERRRASSQ